ncbi:MAG: hypothetical protein K6T74_17480 [Geminicoccaceae bacterium]|nr:hypothetical protein [Geminicoccaceae bacterium]
MTLAPAPRPRSPAQIEAARRNGARSKGPVTAEGKARASRNALRHGLCSPAILFPGEDPAHFEALRAALEAEYAPASPSARLLVERLAVTVWKLARCDRLEARLATIEPHCPTGRLFPDPGLPRVLSRIPELATLLRWQAQLDRQLHRLTKSLAEHARSASPSGEPPPGEDGPAAEGEPAPPASVPPEALFRPAEAAPARDTDEAVAPDGTTGCAELPTEPEAGDVGLARRPAFSATAPGVAPTARQNAPNEPEAEGERVAEPATPPGRRAGPEAGTGTAEPGVAVPGAGPDAPPNPRNEPEAGPSAAPRPAGTGGPAAAGGTVEPGAAATRVGSARHALPNLPNEPEPGAPLDRAGPESSAECAGADDRDRHRAEARLPDAAPRPGPEALLARGDLAGYLRARTALTPPSAASRRPDPPPSHPQPRGRPDP